MSTTTTNYGLIKPDTTDPILIGQINDNMDTIDTVLKDHSDKIDAAALGIKFKGEVNYYSNLPNDAKIGDAYTVKYAGSSGTTPDGTEYVWGTVSGTNQWINFSKDSYTKAEVDALLSLKANIADIPTPSTAAPAMDGTAAAGTSTDYARADHVHPSDTIKQDALTTAQLAAANSGIDSEKVAQYDSTTELEAEDRAALIELIDGGAKNDLEFDAIGSTTYGPTYESNGVKFTLNADNTVTFERISTSSSPAYCLLMLNGARLDVSSYCDGNHILSGCPSGGRSNTYEIMATVSGAAYTKRDYGTGVILDSASGIAPYIQLTVRSGFIGTATFKPMLCTKAAWNVSQAYVPHRPSYQELYERVAALEQANQ